MNIPVYFAFTTIPERCQNIEKIVDIMKKQTVKPYKIIISIPQNYKRASNKECHISPKILNDPNVVIYHPPKDYGPLTKLWGALQYLNGKKCYLIIGDDDIPYRKDFIEKCVKRLNQDKSKVYAGYIEEDKLDGDLEVLQGCSGVAFYTPLIQDILQYKELPLCFGTDDVWISSYLKHKNIPLALISPDNNSYSSTRLEGDYQNLLQSEGLTDKGGLYYESDAGVEKNRKCYLEFKKHYLENSTKCSFNWIPLIILIVCSLILIMIVLFN